jgi:hypothetical protein
MALFRGGNSSSLTENISNNYDNRALAGEAATAISASGNATVDVQYIPDEAFNLAGLAVETIAGALERTQSGTFKALEDSQRQTFKALGETQTAARSETAQLVETALLIGIPALVLLVLWRG